MPRLAPAIPRKLLSLFAAFGLTLSATAGAVHAQETKRSAPPPPAAAPPATTAPAPAANVPLPPPDPILRIEPGMHTAPIRRLAADAACTILATAADDKTVRLWSLPEIKRDAKSVDLAPRLLRTLRVPIGPGNDGKLFGVAMAADGSWVAAGGWDAAYTAERMNYVYVFDTASGRLLRRLGRLENVTKHLTVSPDGRYMAVALGGGQGVRVWEVASWRMVGRDTGYGGRDSYGAVFDTQNNLYVVASDGFVRRYQTTADGIKLEAREKAEGGADPFGIDVRNGQLAISYNDNGKVELLDPKTLKRVFNVDTANVNNGNLASVGWSLDGRRLYAGGKYDVAGTSPVRVWGDAGRGKGRDLQAGSPDTIIQVLPCGGAQGARSTGRVNAANLMIYGATDPAFGLIDEAGTRRIWQTSVQPDMRGKRSGNFFLSQDGRRVHFGLDQDGGTPVIFDLAAEQLMEVGSAPPEMADAEVKGLPVTDWINNGAPKFNGAKIELEVSETSRALAISPDKQRFVLGTEYSLRAYDAKGTQVWRKATPGVAWGVNITRDGKMLVAAFGDGTVRWHRLSDGQELLALFVHKHDRRWVVWTPKGYYMASPGAESLIGWHVNRGWTEAAAFYPADRFRDTFSRPDVVKRALETLDEAKAVDDANARARVNRAQEDVRALAPPVINILKPDDNGSFRSDQVTIEYVALSPTGKRITDIDVRVNNATLAARSAVPANSRSGEPIRMTLTLPPEDVVITLTAREGARASEPASLKLRWDGAKPGQARLPRLRAMFVGTNAYTSPNLKPLRFAAKDAMDLDKFFKSQAGRTYSNVETRLLADGKRSDILDALEWLEKGSAEGDINMIFLAGHGVTDEQQHFYYMAADSDPEKARASGVSRDELLRTIRNLKGARVVMLDTCHSGATMDAMPGESKVDMNRLANELGDRSLGVFLYASALGRQSSFEHPDWGNGAFTKALLEGLGGAADREKVGFVETDELGLYVRRRVLAMTRNRQEPVRIKPDAAPEMRLVALKQ